MVARTRSMTPDPSAPARAPRRRTWLRVALVLVLLVAVGIVLAVVRYGPLIDQARLARESARDLSARAGTLGPADLDGGSLASLRDDLGELESRLAPFRDLVHGDPLVGMARDLPVVGRQVAAADALVGAADALLEAGDLGLDLADHVAAIRDGDVPGDESPVLPRMVELMATSTGDVDRIGELVAQASARLDEIPDDALGPIVEARDLVRGPLERYGPVLDAYREVDDVVPRMLGRGEPVRYLVLAQNPAELRPQGGYAGTVGVIGLRDGVIEELRFQDVYDLIVPGLPFVQAPDELVDHLLGEGQSWRLADAAWSPDFPTSAREAIRHYAIESGDEDFDGVIAITTFALDRLLEVVGAVTVDEYDVTVEPGDVTLTLLGATRGTPTDTEGRKDVLDALARQTMQRLLALPVEDWDGLAEALTEIGRERMALAWFADGDLQQLTDQSGWSGQVRQDGGDYVYVVESNMAPTSKYNLVVDRSDSLAVKVGEDGNALNSLRLDWDNRAAERGEPYRSLREFSQNTDGWYGAYVRVLAPDGSEPVAANGEASDPINGIERVTDEAGRTAFANYLFMPPGESRLTYLWTVPEAAVPVDDGWEYRLVVQKQPGARPSPLAIRIDLPDGAVVTEAPEGAVVNEERVSLEAVLDGDVEVVVRYALPEPTDG
jgi:Protein of unknown function (DUF4012)